jgi:hypothetical protein
MAAIAQPLFKPGSGQRILGGRRNPAGSKAQPRRFRRQIVL